MPLDSFDHSYNDPFEMKIEDGESIGIVPMLFCASIAGGAFWWLVGYVVWTVL